MGHRFRTDCRVKRCDMRVRQVEDADAGRWDRYVGANPGASAYHRYAWREFFAGYFGKQCYYLAAEDRDGQFVGVLPLVRLKSQWFGDFCVSLPFVNYGGVVADSNAAVTSLVEAAVSLGGDLGVSHIEFRHSADLVDLPSRSEKVAMLLTLPDTPEELGRSIGSKRRSQIRRPQRENPTVSVGGTELLDDFYSVFSRNMRDLGTPVYAKSMFRFLLRHFEKNTCIVSIRVDSTPAAAAFLVHDGDRMEIPWASTDRRFNRISINMLLYWEVLRNAIESGMKEFDFGRSTKDSGTYRFKKQWGAKPLDLYWHYWMRDGGDLPGLNPNNPKYARAISIWQRLPLSVANVVGPRIVRHLP